MSNRSQFVRQNAFRAIAPVLINETAVPVVVYRDQRVVTLAMVDLVHKRPSGAARKAFHRNRHRFIKNVDYFEVCASEIRTHKIMDLHPKAHENVFLLTESGYLLLVKSLNDDLSWAVQRMLVDSYFRRREEIEHVEWELARAKGHIKRAEDYWFARFPHWERIRRYYLDGYPFRVIAEWVERSADSCRRTVKSMEQKGLINPRQAALNRLTSPQYRLWRDANPDAGW